MDIRNRLLALKPPPEPIEVAGETLYVHVLDGHDLYALYAAAEGEEKPVFMAWTIIYCVQDADGKRVFTFDDVDAVQAMPSTVLVPLFKAACRVNGLLEDDADTIRKNLPVPPGSAGSTGSPTGGDAPSLNCSTVTTPAS